MTEQADTIFIDGVVLTMTQPAQVAALAVRGHRVLAAGSEAEIENLAGPGTRRVQLHGRALLPGFIDAHNHMLHYGWTLLEVDLKRPPARSVAELVERIRPAAVRASDVEWVRASGYDQNRLVEGRHPTRGELDAASPQHPLVAQHVSGHFMAVNSLALRAAGIGRETPDPPGGRIARDAAGEPTGLIEEKAQAIIQRAMPAYSVAELRRALALASDRYLAEGLTGQHDMGLGALPDGSDLRAYQEASESGQLRVRSYLFYSVDFLRDRASHLGTAIGLHTGFGNDRLRIGGVKIFADGSLIGRTCAMREPFVGEPGNRGMLTTAPELLLEQVRQARAGGWQVGTHAIGDLAVQTVLDVYEQVQREQPNGDSRFRIEHCGVVDSTLIERLRRLAVIPVSQPRFLSELGDGFRAALGPERARWAYPARSFLQAGVRLTFSSDRPVVEGAPLLGIHDAVNRRTDSGAEYAPHEAISVEHALRCYTAAGAYSGFAERSQGSLSPGMLADIVILDRNPLAVPREEIGSLHVDATYVGGEAVHQRAD